MAIGRIPEPGTGIPESIVDAKGDIVTATAADTPARLAVGTNEHRLVADSGEATGLKYVADTTNYAIAAKGDLLVGTAADTLQALTVGSNDQILVADSSTSTGLKWATPASGGGMTLINTGGTTLTGSSVSISSIPGTYKNLQLIVRSFQSSTDGAILFIRFNGDSSSAYNEITTSAATIAGSANHVSIANEQDNGTTNGISRVNIPDYTNTATWKIFDYISANNNKTTTTQANTLNRNGLWFNTSAINSITLLPDQGTFTAGTAYLYGVS
jgi:hypothetical protein